ncbi:unconventional myosin-XV-like [Sycon ciliatum]|uniref:unconventional myosin-XV-like n=1 Tax=Sycon ciliatum TaxID=27933 RepID=UPI0031F6E566
MRESTFSVLASILHIGNLYFEKADVRGVEGCIIDSADELMAVGALLGVAPDGLQTCITNKVTVTRGELFKTPLKIVQALDARDALAKALYSRLFSYIVAQINEIVCQQVKTTSVAILDIFGFEDFHINSFEQLCINFANENLQFYFNQHIFKLEQEEYEKEQICWSKITFKDNQPCLDLICKRPVGLFSILDDESNFPKASDESFLEKIHQQHGKNSYYIRPKVKNGKFGVRHYAGDVMYTASMFLDKNRDTLRPDLIELLHNSTAPMVCKLFDHDYAILQEMQTMLPGSNSRKKRAPTVAAKFNSSLTELIAAMSQCHPYFVRCIKPNSEQKPNAFVKAMVMEQLRYSGMLETIRIRRAGYPTRVTFEIFARRYLILAGSDRQLMKKDPKSACIKILRHAGSASSEMFQIGLSKVFMREALEQVLEEARARMLHKYVVLLQKNTKAYVYRQRYSKLRQAAVCLQGHLRTRNLRKLFNKKRRGAVKIQAAWRMQHQRRIYIKLRDEERERKRREEEERRQLEEERKQQEEENRRQEEEKRRQEEEARRQAEKARKEAEQQRKEHEAKAKREAVAVAEKKAFEEQERKKLEEAERLEKEAKRFQAEAQTMQREAKRIAALAKPKMVDVTTLEMPTDLVKLMDRVSGGWKPYTADKGVGDLHRFEEVLVQPANIGPEPEQVETYAFSKYASAFFREGQAYEMRGVPLEHSLLPLTQALEAEALLLFQLIMRFMGDQALTGSLQSIVAKYIVQKACNHFELRDELFSQVACQLHGSSGTVHENGWLLMALALSCVQPSNKLYKYLYNLVVSQAPDGHKDYCLQCMRRSSALQGAGRSYPPSLLEMSALEARKTMALQFDFVDGKCMRCTVDSLTTAEEIASHLVYARGGPKDSPGWTVALQRANGYHELSGFEHVMDLVAGLELPDGFPDGKQPGIGQGALHRSRNPLKEAPQYLDKMFGSATDRANGGRSPAFGRAIRVLPVPGADDRSDGTAGAKAESSQLDSLLNACEDALVSDVLGTAKQKHLNISFSDKPALVLPSLKKHIGADQEFDKLLSYNTPSFKFVIRKEMLHHTDKLSDLLANQLIYLQIVKDALGKFQPRLTREDRQVLLRLLDQHQVNSNNFVSQPSFVKKEIVQAARAFPIYFARIYPVTGVSEESRNCTHLAVGHNGISMLQSLASGYKIIASFLLTNVEDFSATEQGVLKLTLRNTAMEFTTKRASVIADTIENWMRHLEQDAGYVLATQDYITAEDSLLSFHTNDIIKLEEKEGGNEDGWLFGAMGIKYGSFLADLVTPIIGEPTEQAVEQAKLLIKKKMKRDQDERRKQRAAEKQRQRSNLASVSSDVSVTSQELASGKFSMLEFAIQHFRYGQERTEAEKKLQGSFRGTVRSLMGRSDSKRSKSWSWREYADLVKFTKSPIQASLLKIDFKHAQANKLAVECFLAIMRFMGDYLMKGSQDTDLVYFLLKTCHDHEDLRDEVYCQLIKQTTTNKSTRPESCARGWRLLMICTAYFTCSERLRPYLFTYLQATAQNTKREFHAIAGICEANLRLTFRLGGRKDPPSKLELKALAGGRHTKRQLFFLPGEVGKMVKVKTCTIAQDVIKDLCGQIGLASDIDLDEFALFADLGKQSLPLPIQPNEYILDITTMLERQKLDYWLGFKKIAWFQPLRLESTLFVNMLYHQLQPDIARANLIALPEGNMELRVHQMLVLLAALQHRITDHDIAPFKAQVAKLLPPSVVHMSSPEEWVAAVVQDWDKSAKRLSPDAARRRYLNEAMKFSLYGSCFFPIKHCSDVNIRGECLMAISKTGVHFLSHKTREAFLTYAFSDIVAVRKLRSNTGQQFVDLKCGNLMLVKVTRCETAYGREIGTLIALYKEKLLEEKRRSEAHEGVFRADAALAAGTY